MGYTPLTINALTTQAEVGYSNERSVVQGNNMVLTDAGANSTYTFQTLRAGTPTANITLTSTSSAAHYCDATGGAIAVTLPSAATSLDKLFIVKKVDSSGNAVTVTRAGSDTIDGSNTYALTAQYDWVVIQSDGTATWRIIGRNFTTGAPSNAQYLTLASDATLSAERTFTAGNNVFGTDAGANSTYTVQVTPHTVNTGTTVNLTNASNTIQLCDATTAGGAVTVNLPAISGATSKVFTIKKFDSGADTVTIDGNSSETIDGAATYVISIPYQAVNVVCTSGGWALF